MPPEHGVRCSNPGGEHRSGASIWPCDALPQRGRQREQRQAENEVERGVEVRLGRERDRASEEDYGGDDDQQDEDHTSGETRPCPITVGAGEQHGLLRQHDRADRSSQTERSSFMS